jgi:hypothetical protein
LGTTKSRPTFQLAKHPNWSDGVVGAQEFLGGFSRQTGKALQIKSSEDRFRRPRLLNLNTYFNLR